MNIVTTIVTVVIMLLGAAFVESAPIRYTSPTLSQVLDFLDRSIESDFGGVFPFEDKLGNCSFNLTVTQAADQSHADDIHHYMSMGVCMLHTFWPSEAMKAFRMIMRYDDASVMAYWGLAQALMWDAGSTNASVEAMAKAQDLIDQNPLWYTPREKLYSQMTTSNYPAIWQAIIDQNPDDLDAKALYAWSEVSDSIGQMGVQSNATLRATVQNQLENLTTIYPRNVGFQHYIIHAFEDTWTPGKSLGAVEILPSIAPNAGHVVHMPGHIYFLLADTANAHAAFSIAEAVDIAMMRKYKTNLINYWEWAHNVAYMVANLAEGGQYSKAISRALDLQASFPDEDNTTTLLTWDPAINRAAARYFFQGLIALPLVHFQYSEWSNAQAAIGQMILFQKLKFEKSGAAWVIDYWKVLQFYACAMHGLDSLDYPHTLSCYSNFTALMDSDAFQNKTNVKNENGFQVMQRCYQGLETMRFEMQGVLAALQGKYDEAITSLAKAAQKEQDIAYNEPPLYVRPILQTIGNVRVMWANSTQDPVQKKQQLLLAVEAFQNMTASLWHNNSAFGWFCVGQTYTLLNDVPSSTAAYNNFLARWQFADSDNSMVRFANMYLAWSRACPDPEPFSQTFTNVAGMQAFGVLFGVSAAANAGFAYRHYQHKKNNRGHHLI